jgi:HD-GYP domain-containing protein (c-di-GMP phosphodiesterase class II)
MCQIHEATTLVATKLDASTLVDELVVALSNARIYRPEHPRVTGAADAVVAGLQTWFASESADRLEIGTSDGFLFHACRPLLGASLSAARLIEPLGALGSAAWLPAHDVRGARLVALLSPRARASSCPRPTPPSPAGCARVRLLPPYRNVGLGTAAAPAPRPGAGPCSGVEATPRAVYQGTVELLQDATIGAARGEELALDAARGIVERIQKRIVEDAATILGLSRYERYDEFTFGHSIRVCLLAVQFAASMTRDERVLNRVGLAALLHDIGKSRIPFEMLHARRRLDPAELAAVGRHAELGAEILLDMPDPDMLAVAVAFGHHRSNAGGGYPRTADEAELSLATRLIRICDVYEALTAVRPYKARMSPLRAYRIMMGTAGQFDAGLLRRFIRANGLYPVGGRVLLESGERALVRRQTRDVAHPVVELEHPSVAGAPLARRQERDLSELRDDEGWRVKELILEDQAA